MLNILPHVLKRYYQFFRRPKVTVFIIIVLLLLFFTGLIVPQKVLYRSRAQFEQWNADHPLLSRVVNGLHLNEIYVAPITILFLGLFFANLLVVLVHRVPLVLKRAYLVDTRSAIAGLERVKVDAQSISIVIDGTTPAQERMISEMASSFFRRRFWSVLTAEETPSFVAVRNRFSPVGFLLFHLSFFLCLIGGLLVMYTRFSGDLTLTEGEEFHSDITQFRRIRNDPKILHALPELGITLLKIFPSYEGSIGTDLKVAMKLQYFSDIEDVVTRVNEPVKKGSVSILPQSIGVSPLFILRKKGGEEVQGGYFSLSVLKGEEDSFEFPGLPYMIYVRFYPDFAEEAGRPATKSLEMKNPVFRLRVEEKGRVLYDGLRKPGEEASFDSLELSVREIRYWVDLLIIREYGNIPLFTGFIIGAIGLIMRLVFFQKTVRVHIESGDGACTMYLGGRSEYYQQIFREEMDGLAAGLSRHLREGGYNVKGETTA